MRALLVVNPTATTTSARARDVIGRALASELKLDVCETASRGHACELAQQARRDGYSAVIALGGDGTVNEVVNGLLADGLDAGAATADAAGSAVPPVPALGVVPGGSTNVFARAVGLASSPIEATSQLLDAVRTGRRRRVGLGKADDRYFTFCAGLGLDAEVIDEVERRRRAGRSATARLVLSTALQHFFLAADRRVGPLTVTADGQQLEGVHTLIVANGAPWTYLGTWPVNPLPRASFELGLDAVALQRMSTAATVRYVTRMLSPGDRPLEGRGARSWHDVSSVVVSASRPTAFQLDGDAVGERHQVVITSAPDALAVLV